MPDKKRLVTSKVCFGSEKAGLLENSYDKCALAQNIIELQFGSHINESKALHSLM